MSGDGTTSVRVDRLQMHLSVGLAEIEIRWLDYGYDPHLLSDDLNKSFGPDEMTIRVDGRHDVEVALYSREDREPETIMWIGLRELPAHDAKAIAMMLLLRSEAARIAAA